MCGVCVVYICVWNRCGVPVVCVGTVFCGSLGFCTEYMSLCGVCVFVCGKHVVCVEYVVYICSSVYVINGEYIWNMWVVVCVHCVAYA